MSSRLLPLALLAALAVSGSGCASYEMARLGDRVAAGVERQPGVEVGPGSALGVGRVTIGTGRFLGRLFAPSATRPYRRLSGHLRGVEVAHYPLTGSFDALTLGSPAWLAEFEADGWLPLVTVRDEEAFVVVRYRERADVVTDMLVVTVAQEDLVLVQLSGDLSALALEAVEMDSEVDVNGRRMVETLFGAPEDEPGAEPTPSEEPPTPPTPSAGYPEAGGVDCVAPACSEVSRFGDPSLYWPSCRVSGKFFVCR